METPAISPAITSADPIIYEKPNWRQGFTMQKKVYNYATNLRHVLVLMLDGVNNTIGGDIQSYLYIDDNVSNGNNNDGDNKIR